MNQRTPLDRIGTHLARGGASTWLQATLGMNLTERARKELAEALDRLAAPPALPAWMTTPGPCHVHVHVPAQTPKPVRAKGERP